MHQINLAPIVLFVYKRPDHLRKVLDALFKCPEIGDSILYVFSDAPKRGCVAEDLKNVKEVRRIVREIDRCGKLIVVERSENYSFLNHIMGITEVIERHGRAIVLEDDLIVAPGFLTYMNRALELYAGDDDVMHVSGYMLPLRAVLPDTLFYNAATCWGWGTWARAWRHFRDEPKAQLEAISKHPRKADFDCPPYWYLNQMRDNVSGAVHTWDGKWHASVFLRDGMCLHPGKSLVKNIGHDGTGENCVVSRIFDGELVTASVKVERIEKREHPGLRRAIRKQYGIFKPSLIEIAKGWLIAKIRTACNMISGKLVPALGALISNEQDASLHYSRVVNSQIDSNARLYPSCRIEDSAVGAYSYVAEDSVVKNADIGKFVSIGTGFKCGFGLHPIDGVSTSPVFYSIHKQCGATFCKNNKYVERKRIRIGNDVYIGMNVTLLDGVTVGDGAVIGAGAVVVSDIPPYAVAVGVPARVIKFRFDEDTVARLLESRWWDGDKEIYMKVERHIFDVGGFLRTLENQDVGAGKET